jgi:hypothetical protein
VRRSTKRWVSRSWSASESFSSTARVRSAMLAGSEASRRGGRYRPRCARPRCGRRACRCRPGHCRGGDLLGIPALRDRPGAFGQMQEDRATRRA